MSGMNITASDLITIIKTCGENHVEELTLDGVFLKFYNTEHHNQNGNIALSQDVMSEMAGLESNLDQPIQDEKEADMFDDLNLTQLAIEDPMAYEELVLKKLIDEGI